MAARIHPRIFDEDLLKTETLPPPPATNTQQAVVTAEEPAEETSLDAPEQKRGPTYIDKILQNKVLFAVIILAVIIILIIIYVIMTKKYETFGKSAAPPEETPDASHTAEHDSVVNSASVEELQRQRDEFKNSQQEEKQQDELNTLNSRINELQTLLQKQEAEHNMRTNDIVRQYRMVIGKYEEELKHRSAAPVTVVDVNKAAPIQAPAPAPAPTPALASTIQDDDDCYEDDVTQHDDEDEKAPTEQIKKKCSHQLKTGKTCKFNAVTGQDKCKIHINN